nr:putative uncharacterized protein DDB_G0282133 [Vanessa tameamea]
MESSEENTNINEKQISLPEINVPNTFINNIEDNVEAYGQNISQQIHPTKRIKRQIERDSKKNIFGPNLTQIDNNKADKESFEARMGILTPEHIFTSQNYNFQSNKPMELEKKDNRNNNCLINSQHNIVNNNVNEKRNAFTTGVVNIVVAQVNNTSILDYNQNETLENLMLQESLTSAESFISQLDTITSTSNSEMSNTNSKRDYFTIISSNESSSITLTPPQTNFELISENDDFVMAKTSSYFKKNNSDSIRTLTPEGIKDKLKLANNDFRTLDSQNTKPFSLDTIINMKIYPNIPENKCQNLYIDNCDNVIITNDKIKTKPASTFENDYNAATRQIILKNIDKKSYRNDDSGNRNHIYLPDENTIKDMLTETDNSQKRSCSEESRNYIPIADLWEKLSTLLDNAIRKLEETIMEKIKNEIKQVLGAFESNMNLKLAEPSSLDEGLQCCLFTQ